MKRALLSPEARILLLSISPDPDLDAVESALEEPSFDWTRLMWLAGKEKATATLWQMLRALPEDESRSEAIAQLGRMSRVSEFRMMRLEQLLAGALDTLAARGINVLLLKGAGLATTVYGSFAERPMYDVDLLVHPERAREAWNALRAAGWMHDQEECPSDFYDTHYHLPPLDDAAGTGLALELHTGLTDGAIELSGDIVWGPARPIDVKGRHAFVPAPEHQVLHLSTHFAWTHGMGSAAWRSFHDLGRLIERAAPDWDIVVREARAARAVTACYWTFRLAKTLAGVPVPDDVLKQLKPPRPEAVLKLIERHYAATIFAFSPAPCPSVRITQWLWSAGMAPRWSGHGSVRPWHRGEMWGTVQGTGQLLPLRDRLKGHLDRGTQWSRYASTLLSPASSTDRPTRSIAI